MIRLYRPESDRAGLRACIVDLQEYERALEPALPAGADMADPYLDAILERCARHAGVVLVAEQGGAVVGFTCVLTAVMPDTPDDEQRPFASVTDLGVLAQHRGRGIGGELLERAEEIARESGAASLYIGVLAKNAGAHRLYERAGFRDYHVRMVKRLRRD